MSRAQLFKWLFIPLLAAGASLVLFGFNTPGTYGMLIGIVLALLLVAVGSFLMVRIDRNLSPGLRERHPVR